MKNNPSYFTFHSLKNLFFFSFLLVIISGCTTSQNDQTFIQFNNPANALKHKSLSRAALPDLIDSLVIKIEDTNGRHIKSVNILNSSSIIKLSVPSNISLIVSANASANDESLYFGEVTINPIKSGGTANPTLLLYNKNQTADPIQVDIPIIQNPLPGKSKGLSFSRDNNYVLFSSDDENLVSNDLNSVSDIFLRDLSSNIIKNLHTNDLGESANTSASQTLTEADISADGIYAVFSSDANNLVFNDTNGANDIFLKNTLTGAVKRINERPGYNTSDFDSYNPQISDDGSVITFYSEAELISGVSNTIFIYNRLLEELTYLNASDVSDKYKLSGDGNVIVYQVKNKGGLKISNVSSPILLESTRAISIVPSLLISNANIDFNFNVDQDGKHTLFIPASDTTALTKDQIYLYNSVTRQISLVSKTRTNQEFSGLLTQRGVPALSNDGRYAVFSYNNFTYVRNIKSDNLLEIGSGSNPFVSTNGDKIGFEKNDHLLVIDNPLYIAATEPAQKATAPTNITLDESDTGTLSLSWGSIPNASYYRIYQSEQSGITNKLIDPLFLPVIRETINTNISFNPYNDLISDINPYFYFVIFAVNENGEGIASAEITNKPAPPVTLKISSLIENTNRISIKQPIKLFFSDAVVTTSIAPAIKINDSESINIPFQILSSDETSVTLMPIGLSYTENRSFTLTVDQQITAVEGPDLAANYVVNFSTGLYFNEGSFSNPLTIYNHYKGVVESGMSYYTLPIPSSNSNNGSIAVYLENTAAQLSLNVNGSQGETITCTNSANVCIVENINSSSQLNIMVDGQLSEGGADFEIAVSKVNIVNSDNPVSSSFMINTEAYNGFIWIKGLEASARYHLTDLTLVNIYDHYNIFSLLDSSAPCKIEMGDGTYTQCNFKSTDAAEASQSGEILLHLNASLGVDFSKINRTYQLDIMRSRSVQFNTGSNNVAIKDEKYVEFINLTPGTTYYLSLSSAIGSTEYKVSSDFDFQYSNCTGLLNAALNDLDSCAFIAGIDGSIFVNLNHMQAAETTPTLNIDIFELTPDLILNIDNSNIIPDKRLMFGRLYTTADNSWYSIKMMSNTGNSISSTATLITYDNLETGPQCKSELITGITSCEIQNNANHLIAFEFSPEIFVNQNSVSISNNLIIETPLDSMSADVTPLQYFSASPLPANNAILITATTLISTSNPTMMNVYREQWRSPACTTVRVANNLLCVTDQRGFLNTFSIKVFDHYLFQSEESPSTVDVTMQTLIDKSVLIGVPRIETVSGDFEIFSFSGLDGEKDYSISISNTSTNNLSQSIPFYVVHPNDNLLICRSSQDLADNTAQNCIVNSDLYNGFIIVDSSAFTSPVSINIQLTELPPPPIILGIVVP